MTDIDKIAKANDLLRQTFLTGKVVMTAGVHSLPDDTREEIITKVRGFGAFTEDNDPYGEHDFGAFDQDGVGKVFWKIDYYDPTLTKGSEDPADPKQTRRVLTILLAEEY
ncbi:MAG: DUF3768 domain-containing protein [Desulfomicrobium sp.]|uniref:DUF3768 domain-containing protein n=1 Tax=Hoeflea sp. TaxID=1940281 RepID=UPI0025C02CC4|nr:DUF3768 domain-containing protein [Hoeflea sp.]MBV1711589.1 DUF3768 domain-containing protein [Desulfomicrobium sp.]MBV1782313.1 DUF3768 domain-containing protein [Hoeflea sp.]